MKINRFVGLAIIAVLVVATMSVISVQVFAQTSDPTAADQDCDVEDDDAAEAEDEGPDLDDVEFECGDQDEDDDDVEDEFEDESEEAPLGTPAITAEEARQAAEAYVGGGTISEVELESENGKLVYEVEIDGSEVTVDAMTGDVLGTEVDDD